MIRSYSVVNGEKNYDDEMKLVISENGYYLTKDGVIYESDFNNATDLPSEWKVEKADANVNVTATGGNLTLNGTSSGASYLYLDRDIAGDYLVQVDMTVNESTGSVALIYGYVDSTHFGYAYAQPGGYGKFQVNNNGSWINTVSSSEFNYKFEANKTYTLTLICRNNKDVSLFIDGILVKEGSFKDGYNTGKVGIRTNKASVTIDNFIVRTPDLVESDYVLYENNFDGLTEAPAEWIINKSATRENKVSSNLSIFVPDSHNSVKLHKALYYKGKTMFLIAPKKHKTHKNPCVFMQLNAKMV